MEAKVSTNPSSDRGLISWLFLFRRHPQQTSIWDSASHHLDPLLLAVLFSLSFDEVWYFFPFRHALFRVDAHNCATLFRRIDESNLLWQARVLVPRPSPSNEAVNFEAVPAKRRQFTTSLLMNSHPICILLFPANRWKIMSSFCIRRRK